MRRGLRPVVAAALASVLALTPPSASARSASPIGLEASRLVERLALCLATADRPLALTVVPPARDETALSDGQGEDIRLGVETALQATGRVRLAAAADVDRLRRLREGTTGLSGPEAERLVADAFEGDAAVFVVAARRDAAALSYRLQAISRDAACKVTSEPISNPLATPDVADVTRVMAATVRDFAARAGAVREVAVCPIVVEGGHSQCAGVLSDRLADALGREAASANRALRDRVLAVTRAAGSCADPTDPGDAAVATGRFGDDAGRSWLELEIRRGSTVLATLPRTAIDVTPLECDPRTRPFLDHVAATLARDVARLDVSAASTPFRPGERLDVTVRLGQASALHCWVLAEDGTAYVVWPVAGADARRDAGAWRYPEGFGLGEVVLDGSFENLFHCFASEAPLPEPLERRWSTAAPPGAAPALLDVGEVGSLMEALRAVPGIAEAATRIVVR